MRKKPKEYIFIFVHFGKSPQIAKRLRTKIIQFISKLDLFPERYSKVQIKRKSQYQNLRKMPVGSYIIIYEVDNINYQVFILHIFHSSQNYLNSL